MASRWGSFRKEVYGFLNFRPYQHDATPSPAVVLPASPVPPTGPSLTSLKEELSILREELTTILSEQDGLIGEYNISHNTIHDIQRHLIAVASTPPPYSYDDTWYLRNSRDAELRKMEGLTVKMAPLAQILRALLDQITEWEIAVKRKERAESEQIAKETVEDAGNEAADKDQEDIEEDGMRRARKKRRML